LQYLIVTDPIACARYGAERVAAYYLFRPDQHVAARWRQPEADGVTGALVRASGGAPLDA
jgi:3-(3-hydroxy-phenyl)propionate hydroxylase